MAMWLGKVEEIGRLIAAKSFKKAIAILRQNLQADSENVWLRQQLADVLVMDGQKDLALAILSRLADSFAQGGFHAKAIAVIKKMQRIDPTRTDLDEKLAAILGEDSQQQRLEAAIRRPEQSRFARLGSQPPYQAPAEAPTSPPAPAVPAAAVVSAQPTAPAPSLVQKPARPEDEELVIEIFGLEEPAAERARFGAIGRSPLFSELSDPELVALMQGLRLLTYEPGEIIVSEGEPGDSLFVLASGTVRVYVRDTAGRNRQVRTLDEGEFFGEVSLVTGQARSATITASTPCELLELHRGTLSVIGRDHPQVPIVIREFCDRRLGSVEETSARGEPSQRT